MFYFLDFTTTYITHSISFYKVLFAICSTYRMFLKRDCGHILKVPNSLSCSYCLVPLAAPRLRHGLERRVKLGLIILNFPNLCNLMLNIRIEISGQVSEKRSCFIRKNKIHIKISVPITRLRIETLDFQPPANQKAPTLRRCFLIGPPGGIRTPGLWNRNPLRYPASPRADNSPYRSGFIVHRPRKICKPPKSNFGVPEKRRGFRENLPSTPCPPGKIIV